MDKVRPLTENAVTTPFFSKTLPFFSKSLPLFSKTLPFFSETLPLLDKAAEEEQEEDGAAAADGVVAGGGEPGAEAEAEPAVSASQSRAANTDCDSAHWPCLLRFCGELASPCSKCGLLSNMMARITSGCG